MMDTPTVHLGIVPFYLPGAKWDKVFLLDRSGR